jgi:hypothetical protein
MNAFKKRTPREGIEHETIRKTPSRRKMGESRRRKRGVFQRSN